MIKQDASYIYMTYTSCHLRAVCNKTHTGTVVHLEVKGPRELLSRREVARQSQECAVQDLDREVCPFER